MALEIYHTLKKNQAMVSQALQLLLEQDENGTSGWVDVRHLKEMSVEISGGIGSTLKLFGTNKLDPTSGDAGVQIGANITTNGLFAPATRVAYLKLDVTTIGTGNIDAILFGVV